MAPSFASPAATSPLTSWSTPTGSWSTTPSWRGGSAAGDARAVGPHHVAGVLAGWAGGPSREAAPLADAPMSSKATPGARRASGRPLNGAAPGSARDWYLPPGRGLLWSTHVWAGRG